jgi:MFS family permease
VLAETHSPAKAGIVGFAQTLPYIFFYLPAGALVDRWDRKRTMIVADAVRTLALASLAIALALEAFELAQVVAVAFVEGSMFVFFSLSESAALPQVVPKEQLPTAVAQNQARIQGADLVGQPLGGALFGSAGCCRSRRTRSRTRSRSARCSSSGPPFRKSVRAPSRGSGRRCWRASAGSGTSRSCAPAPCSSPARTSPSAR